MSRCYSCGGTFDRPGLFGCTQGGHQQPDVAQMIAAAIEADIRDRRGIGGEFDSIDGDTQQQIRDEWASIIRQYLDG